MDQPLHVGQHVHVTSPSAMLLLDDPAQAFVVVDTELDELWGSAVAVRVPGTDFELIVETHLVHPAATAASAA